MCWSLQTTLKPECTFEIPRSPVSKLHPNVPRSLFSTSSVQQPHLSPPSAQFDPLRGWNWQDLAIARTSLGSTTPCWPLPSKQPARPAQEQDGLHSPSGLTAFAESSSTWGSLNNILYMCFILFWLPFFVEIKIDLRIILRWTCKDLNVNVFFKANGTVPEIVENTLTARGSQWSKCHVSPAPLLPLVGFPSWLSRVLDSVEKWLKETALC